VTISYPPIFIYIQFGKLFYLQGALIEKMPQKATIRAPEFNKFWGIIGACSVLIYYFTSLLGAYTIDKVKKIVIQYLILKSNKRSRIISRISKQLKLTKFYFIGLNTYSDCTLQVFIYLHVWVAIYLKFRNKNFHKVFLFVHLNGRA